MLIRRPTKKDLCFLTRCNNSEAKWVGVEEPSFFEQYMDLPNFMVAEEDGKQAGFLMAISPKVDYDSKNFLWFRERVPDFAYVDRVIINPKFRRRGIASALDKRNLLHEVGPADLDYIKEQRKYLDDTKKDKHFSK